MDIKVEIQPKEINASVETPNEPIYGGTKDYTKLDNLPSINGSVIIGDMTLLQLGIQPRGDYAERRELPVNVSELYNDAGYLVQSDLSDYAKTENIPTKVSELENDSDYATTMQIPTKTSELENDSNFAYVSDIPTKFSELENDSLKNVDNTSDENKPVSIAQRKAIDDAYANSNKYTDQKIADLIGGAPETLDTLKEVADAIAESKDVETALNNAIGTKANQTELDTHTGNDTIHITSSERTNWNDANSKKHSHSNKSIIDKITQTLLDNWNAAYTHISDTVRHITASERTNWNGKYAKPSGGIPKTDLESEVQTSLGKADTALQKHQDISGLATKLELSAHVNNTENPHQVTAEQVGLGNCDNTSDADKPISTAQQAEFDKLNNNLSGLSNAVAEKIESEVTTDFSQADTPEFQQTIDDIAGSVSELKNDLVNITNVISFDGITNVGLLGEFAQGGLEGVTLDNQKYRVSSKTPILAKEDLKISVVNGFRVGCVITDSAGTEAGTWSGWLTNQFIIPKNTYFKFQIARVTENYSENASINEFTSAIIYDSIFNHFKESIDDISENFTNYINLFDKDSSGILQNYCIDTSGNLAACDGYSVSHVIPVSYGVKYKMPSQITGFNTRFQYVDASCNKVATGYGTGEGDYLTFTANRDGYVRVNLGRLSKDTFMMCAYDDYPDEYVPHIKTLSNEFGLNARQKREIGGVSLYGKKWCAVGDSLTDASTLQGGENYVDFVSEDLGLVSTNMGVGGTGYANGGNIYWASDRFYSRVNNISTDTDIVTIFGSFNDLAYRSESEFRPTIGDVTDTGTDTICGCIYNTINNIRNVKNDMIIGIILPTPWKSCNPINSSSYRDMANDYVNAIIGVCERYSIPYLDLYHASGLNWLSDTFVANNYLNGDGTHPNTNAHKKFIAPKVEAFIKTLLIN